MKPLYRVRFWIKPEGDADAALLRMRELVGEWLAARKSLSKVVRLRDRIRNEAGKWSLYEGADLEVSIEESGRVTVMSREPDRRQALRWDALVRLSPSEGNLCVEVAVRCSGTTGVLQEISGITGTPRIVPTLASRMHAYAGSIRVLAAPVTIAADEVPTFVDAGLTDKDRILPAIVVSRDSTTREPHPAVDPEALAIRVAGLAHVYVLDGTEAAWSLSQEVSRVRSCFDGAVRLYWPGFSRSAPPFDHRLFIKRRIESLDEVTPMGGFDRYLYDQLAESSVLTLPDPFAEGSSMARREHERLLRDLKARAAESAVTKKEKAEIIEKYTDLEEVFELACEENKQIEPLKGQLRDVRDRVRRLEAEKEQKGDQLQEAYKEIGQTHARIEELESRIPRQKFETVLEVLEDVLRGHPGQLIAHPRAYSTAKACVYKDLSRLHEALSSLATIWLRLASEGTSNLHDEYVSRSGVAYAAVLNDTEAKGRFRDQYSVKVQAEDGIPWPKSFRSEMRVGFDKHLQLGRARDEAKTARIYFHHLSDSGKIVLLHVGRHPRSGAT